ncbi:hypothetical protein ACFFWD_42250 [Bradyrhizobium erythrophlei]|uniref:hypothetical protein n=1 Tax=Bradyrhizobium erythrophlei TaxID=1437360 RepID=UPI0035ED749E
MLRRRFSQTRSPARGPAADPQADRDARGAICDLAADVMTIVPMASDMSRAVNPSKRVASRTTAR